MIISVANPIYDTVFKYLLEDERIVKTLISALLQREVKSVEVRKHEYTNGNRDKISMFRIDFGAQVLQDDGSYKLILIELQKTWLETETLRFRQYLGTQYSSTDNMVKDDNGDSHGIPMVTVYLLGHRVGDIEEPILYVRHKSFDYYGNLVTKGLPDPFVESLVHDSIIVQIPLLRGQKNNRLEEILSIFDQTNKDVNNAQVLNIEDDDYSGDADMERIMHRLLAAASNSKVRQDMNVEEEYFMAIENRDTAIMARDEKIKALDLKVSEKEAQISEKEAQINEKNAVLNEKNAVLNEKNAELNEKNAELNEKNAELNEKNAELNEKNAELNEKDAQLNEKDAQLNEKDAQLNEKDAQLNEKDAQLNEKDAQLNEKDAQLNEKDAQLDKKDQALITSAKALKDAGLSAEKIAEMTTLPVDIIRCL